MKIAKYVAYGALAGLCVGLGLSFFGGRQEFIGNPVAQHYILYSTLIGSVIGGVCGIVQIVQKKSAIQKAMDLAQIELAQSASAQKQRTAWASEVKKNALNLNNTCSKNKTFNKPLVSTTYQAKNQMTEIMNELFKATEKQGKVDALAKELSKKGGASI